MGVDAWVRSLLTLLLEVKIVASWQEDNERFLCPDTGLQGNCCNRLLVSNNHRINCSDPLFPFAVEPGLSWVWYLRGATRINNESLRNARAAANTVSDL